TLSLHHSSWLVGSPLRHPRTTSSFSGTIGEMIPRTAATGGPLYGPPVVCPPSSPTDPPRSLVDPGASPFLDPCTSCGPLSDIDMGCSTTPRRSCVVPRSIDGTCRSVIA